MRSIGCTNTTRLLQHRKSSAVFQVIKGFKYGGRSLQIPEPSSATNIVSPGTNPTYWCSRIFTPGFLSPTPYSDASSRATQSSSAVQPLFVPFWTEFARSVVSPIPPEQQLCAYEWLKQFQLERKAHITGNDAGRPTSDAGKPFASATALLIPGSCDFQEQMKSAADSTVLRRLVQSGQPHPTRTPQLTGRNVRQFDLVILSDIITTVPRAAQIIRRRRESGRKI